MSANATSSARRAAFDDSISQIPLADLALFALYRQG
jgi:hypothetical protein